MKTTVLLVVFVLISTLTFAQKDKESTPEGKWRVNKQYDKEGNLIAYDSTYVWSSTGDYKDFENSKREESEPFFKGFIRDFEMPDLNFEKDSLGLAFKDFFKHFDSPELNFESDFDFPDISMDSLSIKHFQKHFSMEHFDMKKELESLKQQMQELQKDFQQHFQQPATEPKKDIEGKK